MKIDNSSFEKVEQFKYSGTILRNQNSIKQDIKSRVNSGNACLKFEMSAIAKDIFMGCSSLSFFMNF